MLVELRSSDRLRGPKAVDVGPILTSVLRAARDGTADLSRLRVVCDWIQYKRNFREPIARRPISRSPILTEQATGRGYEQALPRGESDARNNAAARDLILELFAVWDNLASRRALPDELHVLELGVGNGVQAKVWLDEFLRLDRERGSDYYRR